MIPPEWFSVPYFTSHDDGTITVDKWAGYTRITQGVLLYANPQGIRVEFNHVIINVANGYARYKMLEYKADMGWWECELVESAIDLPVRAE